ncbi:hypothetical protein [Streptomyces sp. NPDC059781]|uniref:hypothetical protein n=1 Tax=Streptomyces sp. NPDC059781 TaxID=3346943 RepID=UPI00364AB46E
MERLVAAAVAAPSLHNTQPWRFRLDADTRSVRIDAAAGRALRHTDPVGRAVHLAVGCAVLNLRVAAAYLGREPVTRLFPCPDRPALLARSGSPNRRTAHGRPVCTKRCGTGTAAASPSPGDRCRRTCSPS